MRRQVEERSGGQAEAVRHQGDVASVGVPEVPDEEVRRGEDRSEERKDEQRDGDEDHEDRQRRDDQETDEDDGRHLDGADRQGGDDACAPGVLLERVDLVSAARPAM